MLRGRIGLLKAPRPLSVSASGRAAALSHASGCTGTQGLTIDVLMILTLSRAPSAQRLGQLVVNKVPPSPVIT
jgi:hypothetical protein